MENLVKFLLAVILLPLVIATAIVFYKHLNVLPETSEFLFRWGMISFLLSFLFFYKWESIFDSGQNWLFNALEFTAPANKILASILPVFYTVLVFLFWILNKFFHYSDYNAFLMFWLGFTLGLHILGTARTLQGSEDATLWKPTYYFSMTAAFILMALCSVLLLDVCIGKFTFPDYCKDLFFMSKKMYATSFKHVLMLK